MPILTSPTPVERRGKHWNKYAKDAFWSIEDGVLSFEAPSKSALESWCAEIGDEPGQVAKCLHISGRFGVSNGHFILLDHYVFIDSAGRQVGQAVRRSFQGSEPQDAYWPLEAMRPFLGDAGISLTFKVFGYAAELNEAFPEILDQCPTLQPRKRLLGFIPV